ncbi:MAG: hypothetical protein PHR35_03370 [Kiritimatiellae bacterium]|nr:hypothetical protein [Kiritimatiellia bacterium]
MCLKAGDAGYAQVWRFDAWGVESNEHFGKHLRFAVSGDRLLVADSDRHRVLLFDSATRSLLAQAGVTDTCGNGLRDLNGPTLVSLVNDRVVVADTGNQRVVKLVVTSSKVP